MRRLTFLIEEKDDGRRVESFLREKGVSSRLLSRLKRHEEGILFNGAHSRTVDRLSTGGVLSVGVFEENPPEIPPSTVHVPVLYESEDVIVYNKPAGMTVHRAKNHQQDTLENVFAARFPGRTFRVMNRLDRDTTGCVAVAKNAFAGAQLTGRVNKRYAAVVEGKVTPAEGSIEKPLYQPDPHLTVQTVDPRGKYARTDYRVLKSGERHSFALFTLHTGRTHQIRVHMMSLGHPLAGDDMYGGSRELIARQALHCTEVSFLDPGTGNMVHLTAPMPEDMQKMIKNNL